MLKFNRNQRFLLSFFSGVLLSLPWLGFPGWILFFALLPLLLIENFFVKKKTEFGGVSFFGHASLTFLIWNLLSTWWIYHATLVGAIMAISVNSFLMALVFWLAHFARRNFKENLGYISMVVFWIAFEYVHFNWDLEWPWLTLGNGFANSVKLIQWYEFTGTLGGSFWVLIVNILILKFVLLAHQKFWLNRKMVFTGGSLVFLIIVPLIISIQKYSNYHEKNNPLNIVIVQPNINPYNEKYSDAAENEKLDKFIRLAQLKTDDETDLIIGPETVVENYSRWNLEGLNQNYQFIKLSHFIQSYPNAELMVGVASSKYYKGKEQASNTARFNDGKYFDIFNTAIFVNRKGESQVYHKSILVSGVEKVPYLKYFGFLQNLFFDLGGASGNLGRQDEPSVFITGNGDKLAPIICYESVFGEYVTQFIKKDAEFIVVITNDGWWKNSPGYWQHLSFSRLRAVETRRSIARAANTGISCFINQRGDIVQKSNWWSEEVIKDSLNRNSKITFYVKFGDYFGRISLFTSVLLILFLISYQLKKDKKNPH